MEGAKQFLLRRLDEAVGGAVAPLVGTCDANRRYAFTMGSRLDVSGLLLRPPAAGRGQQDGVFRRRGPCRDVAIPVDMVEDGPPRDRPGCRRLGHAGAVDVLTCHHERQGQVSTLCPDPFAPRTDGQSPPGMVTSKSPSSDRRLSGR